MELPCLSILLCILIVTCSISIFNGHCDVITTTLFFSCTTLSAQTPKKYFHSQAQPFFFVSALNTKGPSFSRRRNDNRKNKYEGSIKGSINASGDSLKLIDLASRNQNDDDINDSSIHHQNDEDTDNNHGKRNKRKRYKRNRLQGARARRQRKIRVSDFSQLAYIVGDDDNNGQWMSALLSDIRDMLNPEEVTEKVGCHDYHERGSMLLLLCLFDFVICTKMSCTTRDGDLDYTHLPKTFLIRGGGSKADELINNIKEDLNPMPVTRRREKSFGNQKNIQEIDNHLFDEIGKSISLFTAVIVVLQSVYSILRHDDNALLDEVCQRGFLLLKVLIESLR